MLKANNAQEAAAEPAAEPVAEPATEAEPVATAPVSILLFTWISDHRLIMPGR
jgi:hypothetical protein